MRARAYAPCGPRHRRRFTHRPKPASPPPAANRAVAGRRAAGGHFPTHRPRPVVKPLVKPGRRAEPIALRRRWAAPAADGRPLLCLRSERSALPGVPGGNPFDRVGLRHVGSKALEKSSAGRKLRELAARLQAAGGGPITVAERRELESASRSAKASLGNCRSSMAWLRRRFQRQDAKNKRVRSARSALFLLASWRLGGSKNSFCAAAFTGRAHTESIQLLSDGP